MANLHLLAADGINLIVYGKLKILSFSNVVVQASKKYMNC